MNTLWLIALCWVILGIIGTLVGITRKKLWKTYLSGPFVGIITFVICALFGAFTLFTFFQKDPNGVDR